MSFVDKYKQIIQKLGPVNPFMLWLKTILFSVLIYALCFAYYKIGNFQITGNRLISETFANAGMILIGISFMMSGLTYFWNFVDTKIIYRKYIGLLGFYMTVVHIYIALKFSFENPTRSFSEGGDVIAFLLGCLALAIFLEMAIVSNQYSVRELGNKAWRIILRTGYIAYLFAVIHMIIKKFDLWKEWFNEKTTPLPPLSLIIVVFSIVVFALRIALWFALRKHKEEEPIMEPKEVTMEPNDRTEGE